MNNIGKSPKQYLFQDKNSIRSSKLQNRKFSEFPSKILEQKLTEIWLYLFWLTTKMCQKTISSKPLGL
uniref:Uncharacterized protein n=1 Tax=virus sp. ctkyY8 TaxID=2827995 RepID=A0A8S5REW1_9VIRU|nr:MAG TPA: hypothetical protein [virus sp. ctkyY8]